MKKFLSIILFLATAANIWAYNVQLNGIYYNLDKTNKTASVTYGSSSSGTYSGDVTIPSEIESDGVTYSVTSIGYYAFRNCTDVKSVSIPSSVTSIAFWAFNGCSGLASLTIPNSVVSIGTYAFQNCTGLRSVSIGNSVNSITTGVFSGCTGLTSITIPNSVASIGASAFGGCTGLTSIIIPNSVTSIASSSFYNCSSLATISVDSDNKTYDSRGGCNAIIEKSTNTLIIGCSGSKIPNSVTKIGDSAFSGCTGLTSISIPNTVTGIGNSAFSGCTGLISISLPNAITSIGSNVFSGCKGLTSFTIPNAVTNIGSYAFNGCTGIKSITIPNSVKTIESGGFYGCTGLTSISLPNTVIRIGGSAFQNCTGLTSITIPDSITRLESNTFYGCTGIKSINITRFVTSIQPSAFNNCSSLATITVDSDNRTYDSRDNCNAIINKSTNTLVLGCVGTKIPSTVTKIGDSAFLYCKGLSSITIPNSVDSIGTWAFGNCTDLASITIPSSVTTIGYCAFYGCTSLKTISIPNSVVNIGTNAFYNTPWWTSYTSDSNNKYGNIYYVNNIAYKATSTSITSCTFKSTTVSIADNALSNCSYLTSVTVPDNVKIIGDNAFAYCYKLASVSIGSSLTSIGSNAFSNCTLLTSVIIPKSVTKIGSSAFYYCTGLTSVTLGSSLVDIATNAFYNCKSLSSVIIPESVKTIGNGAFSSCTGLTSVTLGSSVTELGSSVFSSCTKLSSINLGNSVQKIGGWAFQGCTALTSIVIPISVNSIGSAVFAGCSALKSLTVNAGNSIYDSRNNCNAIVETKTNKLITACNYTTIPKTVTEIGDGAFRSCTGITSISIPNSVTSIGNEAFYYCIGLTSITIPNSVTFIGGAAFASCRKLKSISIGSGVKTMVGGDKNFIFDGCDSLRYITVDADNKTYDSRKDCNGIIETATNTLIVGCSNTVIPNTVTTIGDYAFSSFVIKSITLPASVDSVADRAFYGCYYAVEIHSQNPTPPSCKNLYFTEQGMNTLYVPVGSKMAYASAPGWKDFGKILEEANDSDVYILKDIQSSYENKETIMKYKQIGYARTFSDTNWQALYVPLSLSYDEWKDDFEVARLNDVHQYDDNKDGTVDRIELEAFLIKKGKLEPNTPYLIKALTTGEKTISAIADPTLYKTEVYSYDCSSINARFIFTGNYSTINGATINTNGYYTLTEKGLTSGNNGDLGAFRWYMTIKQRTSGNSNPALVKIKVYDDSSDETTAIKQVSASGLKDSGYDGNSIVGYYNLNGVKLSTPQKGIVIVKYNDGSTRKIVIK